MTRGLAAFLEIETHHCAGFLHLLSSQRGLGMRRQPRIVHAGHGGMRREMLGNLLCRARLLAIAHEVGFQTALDQERSMRVEQRTKHRTIPPHPPPPLPPPPPPPPPHPAP